MSDFFFFFLDLSVMQMQRYVRYGNLSWKIPFVFLPFHVFISVLIFHNIFWKNSKFFRQIYLTRFIKSFACAAHEIYISILKAASNFLFSLCRRTRYIYIRLRLIWISIVMLGISELQRLGMSNAPIMEHSSVESMRIPRAKLLGRLYSRDLLIILRENI